MERNATPVLSYGVRHKPRTARLCIHAGLFACAIWLISDIVPKHVWPRVKSEVRRTRAALVRPAAFRAAAQITFSQGIVGFRERNPDWHYETLRPWCQLHSLDQQLTDAIRCARGLAYRRPRPLAPDWEAHAATLFVHGRRSRTGDDEKLVIVMFDWELFQNGHPTPFRTRVETWDGRFRPVRVAASVDAHGFQFAIPNGWPPTIDAGQHDPLDDSHFTIDYETPVGSGTIDGWLQPDDTVKLRVRRNATQLSRSR